MRRRESTTETISALPEATQQAGSASASGCAGSDSLGSVLAVLHDDQLADDGSGGIHGDPPRDRRRLDRPGSHLRELDVAGRVVGDQLPAHRLLEEHRHHPMQAVHRTRTRPISEESGVPALAVPGPDLDPAVTEIRSDPFDPRRPTRHGRRRDLGPLVWPPLVEQLGDASRLGRPLCRLDLGDEVTQLPLSITAAPLTVIRRSTRRPPVSSPA
jgi:hypothetical protein